MNFKEWILKMNVDGIVITLTAGPAAPQAPMAAALLWKTGGYDLVILVALAAAVIGLIALTAAWRSASPNDSG